MHVTLVKRAIPTRVLAAVTLGALLVLAAGLTGMSAPLTALAVAAGIAAAVPGLALICLGLAVRSTFHGVGGACRCVGMMGLGVLGAGLTAAVLPLIGAADRSRVVLVGLILSSLLCLLGLVQVPGMATSWAARLRLVLDGLCVGSALALAGRLVLPGAVRGDQAAYLAAIIAVTCTAIIAAAVLRAAATAQRAAVLRCGTGLVLAVFGLALLVSLIGTGPPHWGLFAAAALVVAGPPVAWVGARRIDFTSAGDRSRAGGAGPAGLDESLSGYPMLALPVAAGVIATAYHLVAHGLPDRTAIWLGMVFGAAIAVREIFAAADLRRRASRLATQEARLRALVTGTGDVTMMIDRDLVVTWQSPAAGQLGLSDEQVVWRRFTALVHPEEVGVVTDQLQAVLAGEVPPPVLLEARLTDGQGGWRETESTVSDLRQVPEVSALVVQVRDVGQRRHLERLVRVLASTDQRTGLPNGRELMQAIAARRAGSRQRGAVVMLGLHGLTAINDEHGHGAGDAVLVEAVRRLRAQIGGDDVAARLADTQLAVVTLAGPIEAYALGVQLLSALTRPYEVAERTVELQVSVGLAPLSVGDSSEEVVRRGELALRRANQLGRNQVEWYDESLEEQLVRRLDLERHLPGAAGRGELDLVYQPVVELDRHRPVGVEALVRWRHPVLGRVLPGELMPVADQLRISGEIGEWVLNTACRKAAAWRQAGHDLWLAVNVSPRQLADRDFVPGVAAALSVNQTPPERLTIEISASEAIGALTGDLAMVANQLGRVRGLGVRTGLDDVGTAHTDLAWLRRLPLDVVKLATPPAPEAVAVGVAGTAPGAVGTAGDGTTYGTAAVVSALVELAQKLGLTVVAEGLEAEAQRSLVRAAGCRLGQGFLVSPPAPAERFEAYLDQTRSVEIRSGEPSSQ